MGTRSRIGIMFGDNCRSVYCHWDGYLEHNGAILQEHYDSAKAANLVALGDISSLGPNIGEKHDFNMQAPYGTPEYQAESEARSQITTFYGRDRGDTDTEFKIDHSFGEFFARADGCDAEFYYIMQDGVWYVGTTYKDDAQLGCKLVPLAQVLTKVEETV
jgi:hypothetical protein